MVRKRSQVIHFINFKKAVVLEGIPCNRCHQGRLVCLAIRKRETIKKPKESEGWSRVLREKINFKDVKTIIPTTTLVKN